MRSFLLIVLALSCHGRDLEDCCWFSAGFDGPARVNGGAFPGETEPACRREGRYGAGCHFHGVTTVALFTRPRRFGKTSALKMIRAFFEKRVDEKGEQVDTSYLFADKKIWAEGEAYRALQGRFPIIYLTFKDHRQDSWESAAAERSM